MRGTVDRIWHNERADGSQYWVLSIDGKRYRASASTLAANIAEGDVVEFAFTCSGRYRDVTGIKRLGPRDGSGIRRAEDLQLHPQFLCMVKLSCLRTAAHLVSGSTLLPEQRLAIVKSMAQKLEACVLQPCAEPNQNTPGSMSERG